MITSNSSMNADLARRLAEAADGLRDSKFYFFISKPEAPFEIERTDGFSTADEADYAAEELLKNKSSEYQKFGPYKTPADGSPSLDYDTIELKFYKNNVLVGTECVGGDNDAIIFNLSAYDKFFLPYYARLHGPSKANAMRQNAQSVLTGAAYKPVRHSGITYQIAGNVIDSL